MFITKFFGDILYLMDRAAVYLCQHNKQHVNNFLAVLVALMNALSWLSLCSCFLCIGITFYNAVKNEEDIQRRNVLHPLINIYFYQNSHCLALFHVNLSKNALKSVTVQFSHTNSVGFALRLLQVTDLVSQKYQIKYIQYCEKRTAMGCTKKINV